MHAPAAIRPRSAIEIVDAAFSLFRNNFATMAVIGLAASVPFVLFIGLGFGAVFAGSPQRFVENPVAFLPLVIGFAVIAVLWMSVIDGAMTFAAAEAYHGNRPSPGDAIRGAFAKGLSLVGGNLLRVLIVGAAGMVMALVVGVLGRMNGLLAFVAGVVTFVFCIHLVARTFAITSAIVIERTDAVEGVNRSFALSKNATLRIVGVAFLCFLILWVAQIAGAMIVQMFVALVLKSPVVAAVLGNVIGMLMYPFLNIALMVLYFDQRVRKEGYDLDVLSSAMPAPAPQR